MYRMTAPALLLLVSILLLAGCKDGRPLQAAIIDAADRQADMRNYSFSGSASLSLHVPSELTDSPVAAGLLRMLATSELTWEGKASAEPAQAELTLQVKSAQAAEPLSLTALIQDNKLYVHTPALTAPDQYIMVDLDDPEAGVGSLAAALPGESGSLLAPALSQLVQAIEHKQFTETTDGSEGRTITAALKPEQMKDAIAVWFDALTPAIAEWLAAGHMSSDTANRWTSAFTEQRRQEALEQAAQWQLDSAPTLRVHIDGDGFIRETALQFAASSAERVYKANIHYRFDAINTLEPFTLTAPEHSLPLSDVLRFISN